MMTVYFIAGLGANKRAFDYLDLSWCSPVFIDWIDPLPKESLVDYALRLRQVITEPNPVIVGVSFGGMLVTEMAKADDTIRAIIISSNKTYKEFPAYLRMWKYLPVYRLLNPKLVKASGGLTCRIMGPQGIAQKETFKKILSETDPRFTVWAIDAILHWQNKSIPANVIHIHGSGDRLLPAKFVKAHYIVDKGRHIMIMDKAEELSALLKTLLVR
ncbi:MAG: alpha/beta hydrolase [Chitinophagaceae bacterium]|nr:alpha/beta hydrolase [Chitinophagaceae bacterium]